MCPCYGDHFPLLPSSYHREYIPELDKLLNVENGLKSGHVKISTPWYEGKNSRTAHKCHSIEILKHILKTGFDAIVRHTGNIFIKSIYRIHVDFIDQHPFVRAEVRRSMFSNMSFFFCRSNCVRGEDPLHIVPADLEFVWDEIYRR